jgi:hypothetical protein
MEINKIHLENSFLIPGNKFISNKEILQFQAPFLEDKLLSTGKFENAQQYGRAFGEFKKYANLVNITNERLPMGSESVDKVWHQFILFTKEYTNFCNKYLGGYMHHTPNTKYTNSHSISNKRFIDLYQENYGPIDDLWTTESWCSSGGCGSGQCGNGCGNDCASEIERGNK